jgi:hypothetical protein
MENVKSTKNGLKKIYIVSSMTYLFYPLIISLFTNLLQEMKNIFSEQEF